MKLVVKSEPRADGQLSVVEAWDTGCVLSNGDELLVKWAKLADLCRELVQEQAAVKIRVWAGHDGIELVEAHRVNQEHQSAVTGERSYGTQSAF